MKLLAIDTSGAALSAAIGEEKREIRRIIGSFSLHTGKNHSVALLPMLDALLCNCGLALSDMDAFAVTIGPGSFTGLRIGVATVKAWGQALEKPLIGISSTEAMARGAGLEGYVCPIFDARRNEVYAALFQEGERLWPDLALPPEDVVEKLRELAQPVLLAGDALPVYGDLFCQSLGENFRTLPEERSCFMAESAAMLALARYAAQDFTSMAALQPVYLRLSEAEEKRLAAQEEASYA